MLLLLLMAPTLSRHRAVRVDASYLGADKQAGRVDGVPIFCLCVFVAFGNSHNVWMDGLLKRTVCSQQCRGVFRFISLRHPPASSETGLQRYGINSRPTFLSCFVILPTVCDMRYRAMTAVHLFANPCCKNAHDVTTAAGAHRPCGCS